MSANCPRCGSTADQLQHIDLGLMGKLREAGHGSLPDEVCSNCFNELAGSVARGSVLLAREKAKEQKKLMLWKSRVGLVKKARALMAEKAFSDAAVAYEKYFRVLESVFEVKPGELTPEMFKESARTQELTIVASAYWDLVRIYDTSDKYGDRMGLATKKLAHFLRFTPIYPDIVRKAEAFSKTCRNQAALKAFLKDVSDNKDKCFIATAAFGSLEAPEVSYLRTWRDQVLRNSRSGVWLIKFYYKISPSIARFLNRHERLKPLARAFLRQFIRCTTKISHF